MVLRIQSVCESSKADRFCARPAQFNASRLIAAALILTVVAQTTISVRASAADYPTRPVRIVTPTTPGASVDAVARILAQGLSDQTGQIVTVENRPGGAMLIGAQAVAQSDPDGYTLFFSPDDVFTILPHLSKRLSYDPNKTLKPVIGVAYIPNILAVNPSVPAKSLEEFIAYARNNPGKISYGSSGIGSAAQVAMEMLKSANKIDLLHVPYKGNAPAVLAAVAGDIQAIAIGFGTVRGLVSEGKLRAIAIMGPDPEPSLPGVRTTRELGVADADVRTDLSVWIPANASPEVIRQVYEALARVLAVPAVQQKIRDRDLVITNLDTESVGKRIAEQYRYYSTAISTAGIPLQD
jgi:tripartite-type tricarboxylate transporter receptor subunit TctC